MLFRSMYMYNILQEHSVWRNLQYYYDLQTGFSVVMHIDEKATTKKYGDFCFLLNILNRSNVFWISPAVFFKSFYGSTNDSVIGFFRFLKSSDRCTFVVRFTLVSLGYHTL